MTTPEDNPLMKMLVDNARTACAAAGYPATPLELAMIALNAWITMITPRKPELPEGLHNIHLSLAPLDGKPERN